MELVRHCLCTHDRGFSAQACDLCGPICFPQSAQVPPESPGFHGEGAGDRELAPSYQNFRSLITSAASLCLTVLFVIVGALIGGVFGALAGWAAKSGILRGAGLCTIAGAVLSLEALEASHAYWCPDCSGSQHRKSSLLFFRQISLRSFSIIGLLMISSSILRHELMVISRGVLAQVTMTSTR
ncbi:unnamed protein product [Cuscuta epithymum]|uniref:Uncharacterized protein n=1 Tax=Cuscuta epithymum TaxID=186058 RepID=A0AAV0EG97_9ASTE|nr:unnamed protein product [Cuscuta epithymum]